MVRKFVLSEKYFFTSGFSRKSFIAAEPTGSTLAGGEGAAAAAPIGATCGDAGAPASGAAAAGADWSPAGGTVGTWPAARIRAMCCTNGIMLGAISPVFLKRLRSAISAFAASCGVIEFGLA